VTFVLTNTSTSARYAITSGVDCQSFAVDDYDLRGYDVFCEGPDAGASAYLTLVPPGGSLTFTWDGRHAVPYTILAACSASFLPGPCRPYQVTARKAAPSGAHTAKFQIADALPDCGGSAAAGTCRGLWGGLLCEPDAGAGFQTITAAFDLAATGGQQVDVPIP